jgi:magnesium-transporting ATPase (P-type)
MQHLYGNFADSTWVAEKVSIKDNMREYSNMRYVGVSGRPHAIATDTILSELSTSSCGLSQSEAESRLQKYGPNALPRTRPPGLPEIFINQFKSPLIYILVVAAFFSVLIQEYSDAIFISIVLVINAFIGTAQEYSAQQSADSLQKLMTTQVRVLRDKNIREIDSELLVPGDLVLLESGQRVPADMRLVTSRNLEIDESLLSGESLAAQKNAEDLLPEETVLGDRINMVFAGTLVNRGRGQGVVIASGLATELGSILKSVTTKARTKAPLQVRMDRFTQHISLFVGAAVLVMGVALFIRGMPLNDIFLSSVALAVSVIPEGLPVALTVALAIGMRRMARRNVIVRRLIAVESLGSCTYIATDKTGTLTANQLTARLILAPEIYSWRVTGKSDQPAGTVELMTGESADEGLALLARLCRCAVLPNEGVLEQQHDQWIHRGDAVDVALLVMADKAGFANAQISNQYPEIDSIPFESKHLYSASLNWVDDRQVVFVKGAVENLLEMCDRVEQSGKKSDIDRSGIEAQARQLASEGYRVIGFASGGIRYNAADSLCHDHLQNLTFLGMVGLIDPLRPESRSAVAKCRLAGIRVSMVTGDHPITALIIGRELDLLDDESEVVTGSQLKLAANQGELDQLTRHATVFARIEPQQKQDIVQSLQRNGHFVAVSGDGANDAPALRVAQVGIAMGKSGTDVARETADLIITDDRFDSIVGGVEEGRVSYANIRKVIFLLISTGAAEMVLFTLSLITQLPLPLMAVQLLWLNLVTNGIQDIALAFEPGEGNELSHRPRPPSEGIFNRLMIERILVSASVIGIVSFLVFQWLLQQGFSLDEARNSTLLLMVLFENVHVFNCRSESLSVFRHNPLKNKLLLCGTVAAQLIHIGAMYTPWLGNVLGAHPVTFRQWLTLLALSFAVLFAMELHKWLRKRFHAGTEVSS